jgi:c-di-GMP-binding flagellar brake protein YcgR
MRHKTASRAQGWEELEMDARAEEIFDWAIDNGRTVVVSAVVDDERHSFPAQLRDREFNSFTFETRVWPEGLSAAEGKAQLTFLLGIPDAAAEFHARLLRADTCSEVIVVRCSIPNDVQTMQRRANFRVQTPPNASLGLTFWKIPPHWVLRDKPKPSTHMRAELIDLSGGGMGIRIPQEWLSASTDAQRLRVELKFNGDDAILDGQIVYRSEPKPDGSIRIGVAFKKLDATDNRPAAFLLNRVVADLQRKTIHETANV